MIQVLVGRGLWPAAIRLCLVGSTDCFGKHTLNVSATLSRGSHNSFVTVVDDPNCCLAKL